MYSESSAPYPAPPVQVQGSPASSGGPILGILNEFASGVEIIEDFSALPLPDDGPDGALNSRFELARRQRRVILKSGNFDGLKKLCLCFRRAVPAQVQKKDGTWVETGSPGHVQAQYYGTDKADPLTGKNKPFGYAWAVRCANALSCFVCAPKIRHYRSKEIMLLCERLLLKPGWFWFFLTLTAPHNYLTEAGPQIKKFQEAVRMLKSGRWWQDFKERWGIIEFHAVKAVELTTDAPWSFSPTGVHWHSHDLCVYMREIGDLTPGEAAMMQAEAQARWVQCLIAKGIPVNNIHAALNIGLKLELPRRPKPGQDDSDLLKNTVEYLLKGAAIEITPGINIKMPHRKDRITHWQLMNLALTAYPQLQGQMIAILKAIKGRHWLHWTPGLKDLFGIEDVTDDDIMKEKNSIPMHEFSDNDWRKIDNRKFQSKAMIAACEEVSRGIDTSVPVSVLKEDEALQQYYRNVVHKVFKDLVGVIDAGFDPLTGEHFSPD